MNVMGGVTYAAESIEYISIGLVGRGGFSRLVDLVSQSKPLYLLVMKFSEVIFWCLFVQIRVNKT